MLKKIKELYDKYVLMEERYNQLNQKLDAANARIDALEAIIKKPAPSKFTCRACGKGKYRVTNQKRFFHGFPTGSQWKCDKCGNVADELLSQTLSR